MQPTKPEDYEVAIPIDKKVLKKEVEYMLDHSPDSPTHPFSDLDELITPKLYAPAHSDNSDENPSWMVKALSKPKDPPTKVKCTCAKQFYTKKRNKKKGLIVMRRQSNGYTNRGCPVHFHK